MRVVFSAEKLREFIEEATRVSPEHPVVLSKFEDAQEIEFDAVAEQGNVILWAVSEHVEMAGVHSGDATLVFPAQGLSAAVLRRAREVGDKLAHALDITGPFNVQMLVKGNTVKVIECNLRASRSFPFVSKVLGTNFIREATRVMLGEEPSEATVRDQFDLNYVAVKAPQFSFDRLKGAVPKLGVEMVSTGEVACFGATQEEALLKAMLAAGFKIPSKGALLALDSDARSSSLREEARLLKEFGLALFATPKTFACLRDLGGVLEVDDEDECVEQLLRSGRVDLVFSDGGLASPSEARSNTTLQRLAIDLGIPVINEGVLRHNLIRAMVSAPLESLAVKPWKSYLSPLPRVAPESLVETGEGVEKIKLFVRQPFTETSNREAAVIQSVLELLTQINFAPYELELLTGDQALSSHTFRRQFEKETGQEFNPSNFLNARLGLLRRADAMIVIRTGLSESGAFEVAYNIFGGNCVPIFFAIWEEAPIKTTLLRALPELVSVRYVTFSNAEELKQPLLEFLRSFVLDQLGPIGAAQPALLMAGDNRRMNTERLSL